LGGRVGAERFAGNLNDEIIADRAAHGIGRAPIGLRVEQVRALPVAHVQMDHRRTGLAAGDGRVGQFGRRQRQGRMVGLRAPAAIGRDGDRDRPRIGVKTVQDAAHPITPIIASCKLVQHLLHI
jgi:hypothetical protein